MPLSKNIVRIFSLVTFAALTGSLCPAKEWRGIVPLHSTRDDVHRILGKPDREIDVMIGSAVMDAFHTDGARVTIMYSGAPCASRLPVGDNWSVPPNTVVLIDVEFDREVTLAQLDIPNIEKFKSETDDSGFTSYRNKKDGFVATVNRLGFVEGIIYGPQESDSSLRCKNDARTGAY